ncbi:hypothetical protein RHD99_13890 [Buttiauxella selenatireducens]|uniref:Uncharacterized protein n=1 Tax=Buttiauxella selenatireducens TaxID=3073902 RepID=A0ABY9S4Z2_9ENTR|nr:hypothetical protein [Buttiauxella sp. R73]WMY72571.1 hypothetical protein RHD99_13890 [Buttiauxella sp. R73]
MEFLVNFNELLELNLILFSRNNLRKNVVVNFVEFTVGINVSITEIDFDEFGNRDDLIASGTLEINETAGWDHNIKWCCRIDHMGIRHKSET